MQAVFTTVRNTLDPDLARLYRNSQDKVGLHAAIGQGLVSLGKRAFNDANLRPAPWAKKKDGTDARLRDTGTLAKSPRVTECNSKGVTVGSDRKYAAIHQLGGRTPAHVIRPKKGKALKIPGIGFRKSVNHPGSKVPARPYLPFDKNGRSTHQALRMINSVTRARLMRGVKGAS